MRSRRQLNLAVYPLVALLIGCGTAERTIDAVNVASERAAPRSAVANVAAAGDTAVVFSRWLAGVQLHAILVYAEAAREAVARPPAPTVRVVFASSGGAHCGGDLPTCAIVMRESGGDYNAVNPTGCGGNGCFGAFQFSGAWAGKLGLPEDIASATPEQQDAAARELWANGAGCGNWSC